MTDARTRGITNEIRKLDHDLFCVLDGQGVRHIMRKGYRTETYEYPEGATLLVHKDSPRYIMSLTDNWTMSGVPRDWGALPVLARLREIDAWAEENQFDRMEKEDKKAEENKWRDFRNETEAFLKDFRGQFNKTFGDVNTSNMDKKKDKRRLKDGNL